MNLYTKYRPQDFESVVGQDYTVEILKRQIVQNSISSAYLLEGSRGCGKTTIARILAKAINCQSEDKPCNECEHCQKISDERTLDVIEIDAASNNGVDNIRDIINQCKYAPVEMQYKVFIIDEVHMLSISAFNALLKVLEEPPSYVVFILCTTEKHKLPATILSRCQQFTFRLISIEDMVGRMQYVCKKEGVNATDEALSLIAKCANGALRDALSILDKCISFSKELTEEQIKSIVGISDSAMIIKLLECLLEQNMIALDLFSELIANGSTAQQILNQLQTTVRDLMLLQVSSGRRIVNTTEYINALNKLKGKVVDSMLSHILKKIINVIAEMKNSFNADMVAEAFIVDVIEYELTDISEMAVVIKQLQQEIKELKTKKTVEIPSISQSSFKDVSITEELRVIAEETEEITEEKSVEELSEEITAEELVEKLSNNNIFLYSILNSAEIDISDEISIRVFDIGAYVALKSYLKHSKSLKICYADNITIK